VENAICNKHEKSRAEDEPIPECSFFWVCWERLGVSFVLLVDEFVSTPKRRLGVNEVKRPELDVFWSVELESRVGWNYWDPVLPCCWDFSCHFIFHIWSASFHLSMQLHFSFLKIFASIIVQVQCASISLKIMIWLGDGTMSKPFNQVFGVQLSPAQGEALLFQAAGNDKSPRIPPIRADPRITAQNYRWPINFLTKHLPQIKVRLFVRSVLLPFLASARHPKTMVC